MWWLQKERPRAGRKAQEVGGSGEPMIMSSRVAVSMGKSHVTRRRSEGQKKKKTVKGWSTEEMKKKPSSSLEEDTEEMRKWRGLQR